MTKTVAHSSVLDQEADQNTEILNQQMEPVVNGMAIWDGMPKRFMSNFDGDEREQFCMRMKCMAAKNSEEAVGAVIAIRYWFIHEVDFVDAETKESVRTFRTVLIDADGKMLSVVSQGVAKGVQMLHSQFGTKPIDPPFRAKITRSKTGNGRQFYQLIPE